jgi:outer membrane protein OmpA-like peptidoglycan-associated protein
VARLTSCLQRKAKVGTVDGPLEHEAAGVADRVLGMPSPEVSTGTPAHRSRRDRDVREEAGLAADSGEADAIVHEALRSSGQPLDPATRAFMEPRFGHDFSRVRVHSGAAAELSAQGLNANAFTVGRNIVFGAGRFSPGTLEGRRLLAHELAHVAQGLSAIAIHRDARKDAEGHPARELRSVGFGSKALSKGVLSWGMSYEHQDGSDLPVVQIIFTPYKSYRGKTITFLQTLLRTRTADPDPTKSAGVDVLTIGRDNASKDQFVPFYGSEWDNVKGMWVPERLSKGRSLPAGSRNQPSSATDPNAYLYDVPVVYEGQVKLFESVVVVPETGEALGAIRWGVKGTSGEITLLVPDAGKGDVSDAPTAGFLVAMDRFYAQPPTVGPKPFRDERYDAIVDGFMANDRMASTFIRGMVFSPFQKASFLNADQENKIDPIITKLKGDPMLVVEVGGFADATEKDPRATSEARALAVERYLVGQGVSKASIVIAGFFGAAWTRSPPSPTASRNRRVQLRVHKKEDPEPDNATKTP